MAENSQMSAGEATFFVPVGTEFPSFSPSLPNPLETSSVKTELQDLERKEFNIVEVPIEAPNPPAVAPNKTGDGSPILTESRRVKCPECRYSAATQEQMTRHVRKIHHGENPFQCYMCDYSTYNTVRFEEHVRKHQGIKPYKCSTCPYRSVSKKNLKVHEHRHKPGNTLKCDKCSFIGQHRAALRAHKRKKKHTDSKEFEMPVKVEIEEISEQFACEFCSSKFNNREGLRNHRKNKKKCCYCTAILCSRKLHTLHLKVYHSGKGGPKKKDKLDHSELEADKSVREKNVAGLFTCQVCGWSSGHKPKILLHLIHHPNQTVDEKIVDISILRKHKIMQ